MLYTNIIRVIVEYLIIRSPLSWDCFDYWHCRSRWDCRDSGTVWNEDHSLTHSLTLWLTDWHAGGTDEILAHLRSVLKYLIWNDCQDCGTIATIDYRLLTMDYCDQWDYCDLLKPCWSESLRGDWATIIVFFVCELFELSCLCQQ